MKLFFTAVLFINLYANVLSSDYYDNYNDDDISGWEHIWVGDDINVIDKTKVEVPKNSTFFEFMLEAAKHGDNFKFDYLDQHTGHSRFITKIGQYEQNPSKSLYWFIYILDKSPKKNNPPSDADLSPLSVGNLIVKDKKHYLWWLRTYVPKP